MRSISLRTISIRQLATSLASLRHEFPFPMVTRYAKRIFSLTRQGTPADGPAQHPSAVTGAPLYTATELI